MSALAQPVRLAARRARAFSTRQATGGDQVRQWEQHNAEALIALACTTPAGGAFDGVEVNLQLDEVHLARVLGSSHRVDRSTALIEERPADAIAVYVPVRGDALLEYAGRRRVLRPGQLLLCDADQPHVRGFGHGLEELAVKVPRSAFAALTGSATVEQPIVVDVGTRDLHGRALARLVSRALSPDSPGLSPDSPPEARTAPDVATIVELVAVLATGHSGDAPLAHRAAARAYIDEHFADPHLAAADIAAGAGVSERHLSRVFSDAGTSVPRQVLARRLDAAHHLLATATDPRLRTQDVALRCGFTSPTYFAEKFRARFGMRAGEILRASLDAHR